MNDELRPEYDFDKMELRRVGPKRGLTVLIDKDVAEVFHDSQAVNEALRFLIRVTKEYKSALPVD